MQTRGSTDPRRQYLGCIDGLFVGAVTEQGHAELDGDAPKCRDLVGAGAAGEQAPFGGECSSSMVKRPMPWTNAPSTCKAEGDSD